MLNASLIQQITDYKNSLLSHFFIFCSHFYLLKSRIIAFYTLKMIIHHQNSRQNYEKRKIKILLLYK